MNPKVRAMDLAYTFTDSTDVVKPNIRSIKNAIKYVDLRLIPNSTPSKIVFDKDYWVEVREELNIMMR